MSQTGAKTYYGYLFNAEKKPTKILDALLRSLGNYIVSLPASAAADGELTSAQEENIGDKDVKCLTPAKIAEFYKTVGGDYDCECTTSDLDTGLTLSYSTLCGHPKYLDLMDIHFDRMPAHAPAYRQRF